MMTKFDAVKKQFSKAVENLSEVLSEEKSELVRDASIKRFELAFDLAWKAVKAYLETVEGTKCASPKQCFREAYRNGLIEYSDKWLDFVDMRNKTVHTYHEDLAEEIYAKLPEVLSHLKKLYDALEKK